MRAQIHHQPVACLHKHTWSIEGTVQNVLLQKKRFLYLHDLLLSQCGWGHRHPWVLRREKKASIIKMLFVEQSIRPQALWGEVRISGSEVLLMGERHLLDGRCDCTSVDSEFMIQRMPVEEHSSNSQRHWRVCVYRSGSWGSNPGCCSVTLFPTGRKAFP